jgi:hypothetical protein
MPVWQSLSVAANLADFGGKPKGERVNGPLPNCGGKQAGRLFDHVLCERRRNWNQMHSFATRTQQTP